MQYYDQNGNPVNPFNQNRGNQNNNRSNGFTNGSRQGFSGNGGNNFSRNNGNNQQQQKKHSGAKVIEKNGVSYISAWNYSKEKGMVSVFIAPYNKSDVEHKSQNGHRYVSLMCQVSYKSSGVEKHFPVLMNMETNRVALPEMGWIVNPKAPNGGYCGTFTKK